MSPPSPTREFAGSIALALLAFGLVTAGIRAQLAWSGDQAMRSKIEAFEAEKYTFDVVFLGTSRIQLGIDPRTFDARLSEHLGRPVRSYNLGINGSSDFETDRLLRHLVETRDARLEAVVLEAPSFAPEMLGNRNLDTAREIRWHDLRQGPRATAFSLASSAEPVERVRAALHHAAATLRALTNHGLAQDGLLFGWPAAAPTKVDTELQKSGVRGFLSGLEPLDSFLEDRQRYLRVAKRKMNTAAVRTLTGPQQDAVVAQHALLEDAGLTLLHITAPSLYDPPDYSPLVEADRLPAPALYHSAGVHPDLFYVRNRRDYDHLDQAGATIWSKLVADALAPRLLAAEGVAQ